MIMHFNIAVNYRSVTLGDSVTTIGDNAFQSCFALQSVTLGDSITSIGIGAFYGCRELQLVTIPNSVISIGDNAFEDCSKLQSVIIPDSVTSIGDYAFQSCFALQSVTILSMISISIGDFAFQSCSSLKSITFNTINDVNIDTGVFYNCHELEYIYFNKSMTALSGSLPVQFAPNYHCEDGTCGCSKGYGNIHDDTSSLYMCMPCREGKTSGGRVSECENCDVGSYANQTASQTCTLCPSGRYGVLEGGTYEDMACKNCSVGSFAQADGSKECSPCPAGSHCNITGLSIYIHHALQGNITHILIKQSV